MMTDRNPRYRAVNVTGGQLVYTGKGILHSVNIHASGAVSAANSFVVYDNTAGSGKVLLNAGQASGGPAIETHKNLHILDCYFTNGLYAGMTGTFSATLTFIPDNYK